jgi:hypothetical protein
VHAAPDGARYEQQPSRLEVKKLLLTGIAALFLATGTAHACSSWQICAYRAQHPELYSKWGIRRDPAFVRCSRTNTWQRCADEATRREEASRRAHR